MGDLSQLSLAIPQLAAVPQCAYPAYGAIIAAGCTPDLKCICPNEKFFITLQGVLAMGNCSALDAKIALLNTRTICVDAVPWIGRSRGPELVAVCTVLLVLATVAVGLRFLSRSVARSAHSWDDWLMLVALVWFYGLASSFYTGVAHGAGKHMLMIDLPDLFAYGKSFLAVTLTFPVAALALKFSILYFYHRIFAVPKFTIWCTIIAIVTLAWFIAFVIASFLTCRPLKCSWDPTGPTCKCFDFRKIGYYITTPPDILTNLAILVLPMPWLWGLQMKMKRKLAVTFIFLLGSFSAAGSVVRIPFLSELKVNDIAYSAVDLGIWINVEIGLGIVSGCLPVMRPLFSAAFTSQLRSRFSKYSKSRSGGSERLPDSNDPSSHPSSNAKVPAHRINRLDSGDLYTGPPHKQQKTWYNNLNASGARTSTRDDGESGQGSEEEIIPMGRIQVKHDLEWEQEGPGPKVGDAS